MIPATIAEVRKFLDSLPRNLFSETEKKVFDLLASSLDHMEARDKKIQELEGKLQEASNYANVIHKTHGPTFQHLREEIIRLGFQCAEARTAYAKLTDAWYSSPGDKSHIESAYLSWAIRRDGDTGWLLTQRGEPLRGGHTDLPAGVVNHLLQYLPRGEWTENGFVPEVPK